MSRRKRARRDKRAPMPWEHEDEHQALIGLYRSRREPVQDCPQPEPREIGPDGRYVEEPE